MGLIYLRGCTLSGGTLFGGTLLGVVIWGDIIRGVREVGRGLADLVEVAGGEGRGLHHADGQPPPQLKEPVEHRRRPVAPQFHERKTDVWVPMVRKPFEMQFRPQRRKSKPVEITTTALESARNLFRLNHPPLLKVATTHIVTLNESLKTNEHRWGGNPIFGLRGNSFCSFLASWCACGEMRGKQTVEILNPPDKGWLASQGGWP